MNEVEVLGALVVAVMSCSKAKDPSSAKPDGAVTVHDRPDGVKWRIDAADAAVRRTAVLALGLTMKTALD
jgi:hypothetical protein